MCPAYNYSLASLVAKGHKETMRSLGCSAVVCGDCRSYPEPRTDQLKLLNFVFSLFLFVNCGLTAEPTTEQVEFFETKVRPVLAERCYKCHSHQSEKLKGGLFLDSQEGLMKGGEAGPVITPGTLEKSKLIEAINYENPDLQMPPKGKLPKEQIAALTEWVKMGAPWPIEIKTNLGGSAAAKFDLEQRKRDHWAWQRIKPQPVPACQNSTWARAGPDRFILAKLEQHGLQPAPAAQPRILLRRLYFDLIGLPPTPEQVESFVQNPSPDAYEKEVDRLLSSPRFGERWARHWLDLVRYAETLGHEFDYPIHNSWRYRDYVIRAFNADIPYTQFVNEHIAGDLLPHPRRHPIEHFNESVIATGFFWLGQRDHSPVDVRQHQAELIDNQIDVMTKTFMGVTVACARCHDHKFDAIATKDYYALYGVLEGSRYAQKAIDPPEQLKPKIELLQQLKKQIRRHAVTEWSKQADKLATNLLAAIPEEDELAQGGTSGATSSSPESRYPLSPLWAKALADKSLSEPAHLFYPWRRLSAIRAESREQFREQWQDLLREAGAQSPTNVHRADEVYADAARNDFRGWFGDGDALVDGLAGQGDFLINGTNFPITILSNPVLNDAGVSRRLEGVLRSPGFVIKRRYVHILAAGTASRIRACVDNFTMIRDPIYGGLIRYLDNNTLAWITIDLDMWKQHRAFLEFSDISTPDPADDSHKTFSARGYLAVSRVVFSDEASPPAAPTTVPWQDLLGSEPVDSLETLAGRYEQALKRALRTWDSKRQNYSPAQASHLAFLDWLCQNKLLSGTTEGPLGALVAKYCQIETSISERQRVPAMADGDGVDEFIFIRGNHKTPGEPAPRKFLTALSDNESAPFTSGSGRLELARCMTAASNPLLARVMVNRVWLHLFGRGIVPTPDDFGVLGQRPTHPELLDWLAQWYRTEAGWSTKKLIRLLVTSSTYRMSSKAGDVVAEEKAPDNSLWHRMPVRRLEGEIIRDSMLAISGRLNDTMFGPPVPTHLTEFMEGRGRPAKSGPLDGDGRRSIYVEVRRNFLSPMMRTFDTPVPFTTIGKRTVSNVPAQSLILLNDPFVRSQAELWTERCLSETNSSPEQRINRMYVMAFGRPAAEQELTKALAFLLEQGKAYGVPVNECSSDRGVWTDLCHVAFNLKEFVFIE